MKKLLLALIIMLFSQLLAFTPFLVRADRVIIRVPADYCSIQSAIDAASSGSIILVSSGTYYEHLVVSKPVTLVGEDKATTIIDGNKTEVTLHIKANNVTVNGFTIQNGYKGVYLEESNFSAISGNIIALNGFQGIILYKSFNNSIDGNLILKNGNLGSGPGLYFGEGVTLYFSDNNTIINNIVSGNVVFGVNLVSSCFNDIVNNTMEKSVDGMAISDESKNNTIHHNNFIWNEVHVGYGLEDSTLLLQNFWDDGVEGNYWDDYTGLDNGNASRVAGDGVGDTNLPHLGIDYYPLIAPRNRVQIVWETNAYPVTLLSNSTISLFRFVQSEKKITFTVRGPPDTRGYCNITIPKTLLQDNPWKIMLNTTNITPQAVITENQTHTTIHFTYNHSASNVQIIGTWVIPEFPPHTTLILSLALTLTIALLKRKIK